MGKNVASIVLLAAVLFSVQVASFAGTLLDLESEESVVSPGETPQTPSPSRLLELYLSPKKIVLTTPETTVTRDFGSRRVLLFDRRKNTLRDDSMLAFLAFRVAESENRKMLSEALAKIGQSEESEDPFPRVESDHLFSMDSGTSSEVSRRETDDSVVFEHDGRLLFSYSKKGHPAPRETLNQLAMFMRHEYGCHPKILTELSSLDRVPGEMTLCLYSPGESRFRLTLRSMKEDQPDPAAPSPAPPPESTQPYALAATVAELSTEKVAAAQASLLENGKSLMKSNRALEALASFTAYAVATGSPPGELTAGKEALAANEDAMLLASSISPKDEQQAEKALSDLAGLESSMQAARPMVSIFRANLLAALGKPEEALSLFTSALSSEPCISGAWFDMGAVYQSSFDMLSAWKCYDTGKKLCPTHPASLSMGKEEEKMIADHPEFFL